MQIVSSGLSPDDQVVVNGLLRATPGSEVAPQRVKIASTPQDAAAETPKPPQPPPAKN
jgi:hypothetical protein